MRKIEISVIVPIYKVEKYIRRCINSIIDQSFQDIEIILVDDGSPDLCPKICDEYKEKDSRISVIHQKKLGLSAARNSGIKIAKGKYLVFIDSDDYIDHDMLKYLYSGMKDYNADIVCCGYTAIYDNGKKEKITIPNKNCVYNKEEALKILMCNGFIDVVAWNKLYKKELFNNILYPVGKLYEDMLTTYKLVSKSNIVVLKPETKYFYCKRSDSIGGNGFSKNTLKLLDACDEVYEFISKNYGSNNELEISRIQWYIVVLNKMILSEKIDDKLLKKINNMISNNFGIILKNKRIGIIRKLQIVLLQINIHAYSYVYKKYVGKNR